jgi:FtsZ-interacting cell division protein ZipA
MSQLQIGLISFGALIILAVLLYNWWQERNIKREMVRRFEGPIDDVLMGELATEPKVVAEKSKHDFDDDFHIDPAAIRALDEEISAVKVDVEPETIVEEPVITDIENEAPLALKLDPAPEPEIIADELEPDPWISNPTAPPVQNISLPPNVDEQIDVIAIITPNRICTGLTIREALLPLPAFQKSVRWMGHDASGNAFVVTKEHEQTEFTHIVCALQLADRGGPAHGEDLRNFHAKVEELTERVGGALEWREHGDPLQYARDLDQFCIDVDVMINLQLASGSGPFAGTKLRGLAEASGLTLKDDGYFHFIDDRGTELFVLASLDRRPLTVESLRTSMLNGVMLMMDVPRVGNGIEVFNQMVMLGRKLETALATKLTDENQQQLGDSEIDKIRQQLKAIYSRMLSRHIVPGSPAALRLFS